MSSRSLSKREADLILALEWERQRLVTLREIAKRLRCSPGYARKLAHVLQKKGWLEPVAKGQYFLIGAARGPKGVPEMNPYLLARIFPKPHFIAYRAACTHHGLLTQVSHVIHVAALRQRRPLELKNVRFEFVKLDRDRFFGFKEDAIQGERVQVSDLERSVLDALDRPEFVGGIEAGVQVLFHAGKKLDAGKVLDYLRRFDDSALARRFGYLCEALRIALPDSLSAYLGGQVKKDPAYLGAPKRWGNAGERNKRWNLVLNVPHEELMGEVYIG